MRGLVTFMRRVRGRGKEEGEGGGGRRRGRRVLASRTTLGIAAQGKNRACNRWGLHSSCWEESLLDRYNCWEESLLDRYSCWEESLLDRYSCWEESLLDRYSCWEESLLDRYSCWEESLLDRYSCWEESLLDRYSCWRGQSKRSQNSHSWPLTSARLCAASSPVCIGPGLTDSKRRPFPFKTNVYLVTIFY